MRWYETGRDRCPFVPSCPVRVLWSRGKTCCKSNLVSSRIIHVPTLALYCCQFLYIFFSAAHLSRCPHVTRPHYSHGKCRYCYMKVRVLALFAVFERSIDSVSRYRKTKPGGRGLDTTWVVTLFKCYDRLSRH